MKKTVFFIVVILLLALNGTSMAQTSPETRVDLVAGQTNDVGDVYAYNDSEYLYVVYELAEDFADMYCWSLPALTGTHLHVTPYKTGDDPDVPEKNGNPIPGQFGFGDYLVYFDGYIAAYQIPLGEKIKVKGKWDDVTLNIGNTAYIAAHGGVYVPTFQQLLTEELPDTVTGLVYNWWWTSYFRLEITNGGILDKGDGIPDIGWPPTDDFYEAWCADIDLSLSKGCNPAYPDGLSYPFTLDFDVVPGYFADLTGIIGNPANIDMLTWLLNQDIIGQDAGDGDGLYTAGDFQIAIWLLLEDYVPLWDDMVSALNGGWPVSEDRVIKILTAAEAGVQTFSLDCCDLVPIFLVPHALEGDECPRQPLMISIPISCGLDDTVWAGIEMDDSSDRKPNGYGYDFSGNNWATYFTHYIAPVAPPD